MEPRIEDEVDPWGPDYSDSLERMRLRTRVGATSALAALALVVGLLIVGVVLLRAVS